MLAHAEPGSEWDFTILAAAETRSARQILGVIPFPPG